MPKALLVLEDDRVRLRGFADVVPRLGADWDLRAWRDAHRMLAEIHGHLDDAMLISLDHDLLKDAPTDPDPGTGCMIAAFLAGRDPACPVIEPFP